MNYAGECDSTVDCSVVISLLEKESAEQHLPEFQLKRMSVAEVSKLINNLNRFSTCRKVKFSPRKTFIEHGSPSNYAPFTGCPPSPSILKVAQCTVPQNELLRAGIHNLRSPKRKLTFSETPSDSGNADLVDKKSTKVQPEQKEAQKKMPKSKRKQELTERVVDIIECLNDSDLNANMSSSSDEETWVVTKKSPNKKSIGNEFQSPPSRSSVRRNLNPLNGSDLKKKSPKVTPIKLKRKVDLEEDAPSEVTNVSSIKTPKRLDLKKNCETPKSKTSTPAKENSKTQKKGVLTPSKGNSDEDDDPSNWEPVTKTPSRKNKESNAPSTPSRSQLSLRNRSTLQTPSRLADELSEAECPRSPRLRESARKSSLRIQVLEAASPLSERKVRARRSTAKVLSYVEKENFDEEEEIALEDVEYTPKRRGRHSAVKTPKEKVILEDTMKTPRSSAKKKLPMTPTTPLSAKKMGVGFLTPVVAERSRRLDGTPSSQLELARTQLHVSTVPKCLPCREKEFSNIKSFLERKIGDSAGGCMYISGVPGTGKTATVHAVVRTLQSEASKGELPHFDFVEVNGLRLTEPRQAYVRLWQALSSQKLSFEEAHRALENKFSGKPKSSTVFLVDELDYLCNRRQDVIYNILDWSTKYSSKLVVLTIANTMDLPERTLKGKVTSRMGLTRVVFQPYTYKQLQEIVLDRLSGTSSFHPDAVQLVSRKVAAVSGDARRALDICRRATEFIDDGIVKVTHVEKALNQIFTGTRVLAIKNCSALEKLVLRAVRDETQRTGIEETSIRSIWPQLNAICSLDGFSSPSSDDVLSACHTLSLYGLLVSEKGRGDLLKKLSLNVSPDDIHYALSC